MKIISINGKELPVDDSSLDENDHYRCVQQVIGAKRKLLLLFDSCK